MSRYLILFILILFAQVTQAHPVAFKGSLGIMGHHSPSLAHTQINYSFRHWWALGVHHFERPDARDHRTAHLVTTNFLLKRWNGEAFQSNIYLMLGAGQSELSGHVEESGLGLIQFDIEDRKYYFLTKHLQILSDPTPDLEQSMVRMGIAPYIGSFNELHSWIILEWNKMQFAHARPQEEITPFLRFFYKNLLFEIGQSFSGVTKFNYIAHF